MRDSDHLFPTFAASISNIKGQSSASVSTIATGNKLQTNISFLLTKVKNRTRNAVRFI